jgi:hypothetical protein
VGCAQRTIFAPKEKPANHGPLLYQNEWGQSIGGPLPMSIAPSTEPSARRHRFPFTIGSLLIGMVLAGPVCAALRAPNDIAASLAIVTTLVAVPAFAAR